MPFSVTTSAFHLKCHNSKKSSWGRPTTAHPTEFPLKPPASVGTANLHSRSLKSGKDPNRNCPSPEWVQTRDHSSCKHPWPFTSYTMKKILLLLRHSGGIDSWPTSKNNPRAEDSLPGFPPLLPGISLFYPIGRNVHEKDGAQPDPHPLLELDAFATRLENGNCVFCHTRQRRELDSHSPSRKNPQLPRNYIKKSPKQQPPSGFLLLQFYNLAIHFFLWKNIQSKPFCFASNGSNIPFPSVHNNILVFISDAKQNFMSMFHS